MKKQITLKISEELLKKYQTNINLCNKKMKDAIKSAFRENELKKLLESDRKNKHGVFEKLNTNLTFIIEQLNFMYEYVASQRLSVLRALGKSGDPDNGFLIIVQSIGINTLCLINQIREMLLIDVSSKKLEDITQSNPFIIGDKQFLKARHYKTSAVKLQTEANEIYEKINKEAMQNYAAANVSPGEPYGKYLIKSMGNHKDEIQENEADTVVKMFHVDKASAKQILDLMRTFKIDFLLPAISNKDNEILNILLNRIINIRNFFQSIMYQVNDGDGAFDELLKHKNELGGGINNLPKIPVIIPKSIYK